MIILEFLSQMRNIPVSGESEERIDRIVWTSSHLDIQHNLYIFRKGFIQFTSLDLSVYCILFPGKPTKEETNIWQFIFNLQNTHSILDGTT